LILYRRFATSKKPPQDGNPIPHNLDLFLCHNCEDIERSAFGEWELGIGLLTRTQSQLGYTYTINLIPYILRLIPYTLNLTPYSTKAFLLCLFLICKFRCVLNTPFRSQPPGSFLVTTANCLL